jgi:iron complex outermembrane receptor protein
MRRILTALVFGLVPRLAAQQPSAPRDSVPTRLEPLTVTAERASRSQFDVPAAVTVVDAAALATERGAGLDEGLRFVPGIVAQSRAGGSDVRIVIRGFGARGAGDRSNAGTSRGVRILVDGVPETEPDGRTSFDNVDLGLADGIEVVRSNGSARWGNAAGGVVNISTVPPWDASRLTWRSALGNFGFRRHVVQAAGRLGGAQLYGGLTHGGLDGWRDHADARRTLLNVGAGLRPDPRTEVRVQLLASDNRFRIPGPLTWSQVETDPTQANATYANRDERRHNRIARLAVAVERATSAPGAVTAMVYVAPKNLERSERGTYREFDRVHVGATAGWRRELALAGGRRLRFAAGGDLAFQDGPARFWTLGPGGTKGGTLVTDKNEGALTAGVYLEGTLTAGRFAATLGGRFDDIRYSLTDRLEPRLNDARHFRGVTPKAGLNWRLAPLHHVYASIGGGVEAPAANETDPAPLGGQDTLTGLNPLLEAIRSTTWEIGTRRRVAPRGGWLRDAGYDVALYLTTVRNEIVPYDGGRYYLTAGSARRAGLEVAGHATATIGATAQLSVTVQRHRYRAYVVDSVYYGRPGAFADYGGHRVVGVPEVLAAAGLGYRPPGVPVDARFTLEHTGRYFADDANTVRVPASTILSVSLGTAGAVRFGGGVGVTATVAVRNLTDRRWIGSAFLNPNRSAGEAVAYEPGAPRTVTVSAGVVRMRT